MERGDGGDGGRMEREGSRMKEERIRESQEMMEEEAGRVERRMDATEQHDKNNITSTFTGDMLSVLELKWEGRMEFMILSMLDDESDRGGGENGRSKKIRQRGQRRGILYAYIPHIKRVSFLIFLQKPSKFPLSISYCPFLLIST